jgi:hypothetical protein
MNKEKKNRLLIIETCANTFPKVEKDRLPYLTTGQDLKDVFLTLFDADGFLISEKELKARQKKTFNDAPLATALWWSVTSNANPYKIQVGTMMLWSTELKETFQTIDKLLEPVSQFLAHLEKDRASLSALGAW